MYILHRSRASVDNHISTTATKSFIEDVIPSIPIDCQIISTTTWSTCGSQDKMKITQEKIKSLLKQVIDNSKDVLASF